MRRANRWVLAAIVVLAASRANAQGDKIVVLTSLPATHAIASALAANTSLTVQNVPERPRPLASLPDYLKTRPEQFAPQFTSATAVVTIGKIWDDDPLFTAARSANIRVIDIDATKPWSTSLEGIAVAFQPVDNVPWAARSVTPARVPSIYFWLSPANGARAAEIVAADFSRLSPKDAEQIRANLDRFRRSVLQLKLDYDVKFTLVPELRVFALAPEFVYLTTDMGIAVEGGFFKQDVDWTADDAAKLKAYLAERRIKVVIHKWDPAAPIKAAVEAAGARLVVLDTIEGGGSYLESMKANLELLHAAFNAAN